MKLPTDAWDLQVGNGDGVSENSSTIFFFVFNSKLTTRFRRANRNWVVVLRVLSVNERTNTREGGSY